MTTIMQVVPCSSHQSLNFAADFNEMITKLRSCSGKLLDIFPPEIHNPYPIGITHNDFVIMKKVTSAVHRGLRAVINAYFLDSRLHAMTLNFPAPVMDVLRIIESQPYSIGSWRPDILFPQDGMGEFLICEINARFPFNGYYLSYIKNHALSTLSYLDNIPVMPIRELAEVPDMFGGVFDSARPVYILQSGGGRAGGWDVHLFQEAYRCSGGVGGVQCVDPSLLELRADGQIYEAASPQGADTAKPLSQFAFELSQEQLLALPTPLLHALATSTCLNDLRTIFLAHDKRMLSVLRTPEIMRDYVSEEDVRLLQQYITPTYIRSVGEGSPLDGPIAMAHAEALRAARLHRTEWILKPNGGGKGEGILLGARCSQGQWEKELDNPARSTHVLQPLVRQRVFPLFVGRCHPTLLHTDGPDEDSSGVDSGFTAWPAVEDMLVVGMLQCFDEHFLGPGVFRAASLTHPIVNVSGGHGMVFSPAMLSCRWPLGTLSVPRLQSDRSGTRTSTCDVASPPPPPVLLNLPPHCIFHLSEPQAGKGGGSDYAAIRQSLSAEGLALVHTHWQTVSAEPHYNAQLLAFVKGLGGVVNMHHDGDTCGVWDVRPGGDSRGSETEGGRCPARSLTADAFEMHTVRTS